MSERNEDMTPGANFQDPITGDSEELADIYGDEDALVDDSFAAEPAVDAPVVDAPVVDRPVAKESDAAGPVAGPVAGSVAAGESAGESADDDYQIEPRPEDPGSVRNMSESSDQFNRSEESVITEPQAEAPSATAIPRRNNHDSDGEPETASDVIPEVESTVVTRRSLLGGARSSIPQVKDGAASESGEAASGLSGSAATASAPAETTEISSQPVVRRSIGLNSSFGSEKDDFASELASAATVSGAAGAAAGSAGAAGAADSAASAAGTGASTETKVQPAIPTREAVHSETPATTPAASVAAESATALEMPSRFAAHAWTFLLAIVLVPLAWYFLTDGIAHIMLVGSKPWQADSLSWVGLSEVFGGALLAAFLLFSARWSTVGVFISSLVLLIIGVPFLVTPSWTFDLLKPAMDALTQWNIFGQAVAHHFLWTGFNGLFAIAGIMGFGVWLAAHGARRKGAQRGKLEVALEQKLHAAPQANIFRSL